MEHRNLQDIFPRKLYPEILFLLPCCLNMHIHLGKWNRNTRLIQRILHILRQTPLGIPIGIIPAKTTHMQNHPAVRQFIHKHTLLFVL